MAQPWASGETGDALSSSLVWFWDYAEVLKLVLRRESCMTRQNFLLFVLASTAIIVSRTALLI